MDLWYSVPSSSYSLTLSAHVQRGLQYLVCPSVCLSVCLCVYLYSRTTGNEVAREQYTRNKRLKHNVANI